MRRRSAAGAADPGGGMQLPVPAIFTPVYAER